MAFAAALLAMPMAAAAEVIDINLGHSHVVRPAEVPGTVIVGDDAIADATIAGGNTVVLTGKALGTTNLIILDETGREILSAPVTVAPVDRRPVSTIRVIKGSAGEQAYLCAPDRGCTPVDSGVGAAAPTVVAGGTPEPAPDSADPAAEDGAEPDQPNP